MKSLNSKDYLFITFVSFILSTVLILFEVVGGTGYSFYLFSFIAIILVLTNPILLFWLFVAMLPFETSIISPDWFPMSLRPFQLFGIFAIVGVVVHWVLRTLDFQLISFKKICPVHSFIAKKRKLDDKGRSFGQFDGLIFLLPVFALLGLVNTPNQTLSFKLTLVLLSFVMIFWLVRIFAQTKQRILETLWFFAVGSIPVLFFGFYQALANRFGWVSFEVFSGRINGTFTEPDWFGMYLSILIAVILWFRFVLLERKEKTMIGSWQVVRLFRGATIGDLFLMSVLIVLTVARSAWLGLAIVLVTYIVLIFVYKTGSLMQRILYSVKEATIQSVIILLAIVFVWGTGLSTFHIASRIASPVSGMQKITISCERGASVPEKIKSTNELSGFDCFHINLEDVKKEQKKGREVKEVFRPDPNIDIRKKIYLKSWQQIKQHPILGQGLGASGMIMGKDEHESRYNASNIFLESWLSMGVGGLIIILLIFLYPIFWALKNILCDKKKTSLPVVFVLLTSLAVLIPNIFNSGLLLGVIWVWIAIVSKIISDGAKKT